jgi:hypothetical protein
VPPESSHDPLVRQPASPTRGPRAWRSADISDVGVWKIGCLWALYMAMGNGGEHGVHESRNLGDSSLL